LMNEIYPTWKKHPLIPTLSATRELLKLNMDLYDVLEILENGYDCAKSKRKHEVLERCNELPHRKRCGISRFA
jgi:hypothetical protein